MVNHYESMFILTPVLSDEQLKEAVDKYRALLKDHGFDIVNDESWGLRKLAYPIQKKSTGFYHLFEFKADPSFVEKWELTFRRDERILRFATFRMDKDMIAYSQKRQQKLSGRSTAKNAE